MLKSSERGRLPVYRSTTFCRIPFELRRSASITPLLKDAASSGLVLRIQYLNSIKWKYPDIRPSIKACTSKVAILPEQAAIGHISIKFRGLHPNMAAERGKATSSDDSSTLEELARNLEYSRLRILIPKLAEKESVSKVSDNNNIQ